MFSIQQAGLKMKLLDHARPLNVVILVLVFITDSFFHVAAAYSIEIVETHPFILYKAVDVAAITERLSHSPYDSWFETVISEADKILEQNVKWDRTDVDKKTQGYYAKMLAFAYVFADPSVENREAYGDEAAKSLYHLPGSGYKDYFPDDLSVSEAAYYWTTAYDMLMGADFDFAVDGYSNMDSTIRGKLKKLRDYMARDYDEDLFSYPTKPSIQRDFLSAIYQDAKHTDNHHIKLYASLTMLSLTIYSESGSGDDYLRGKSRLLSVLNTMTIFGVDSEPAGGWVEGPGYHQYSMRQYVPAFVAMKNLGILDINSLQELVQTHLWLPKIVMPDGYAPALDDNESAIIYWTGLLYSLHEGIPERDMLYWMWDSGGRKMNKALLPEYISQFDDTPPVYTDPIDMRWSPTGFHPESGFARFRSSWENEAVYMLFLTEHGEAREDGQAHEHPDPNSFIVHAYGDLLLMDSGYGGWTEHDLTRFANNHNIILVDGEGPEESSKPLLYWEANGADAYLTEYFTSESIDYALSNTAYKGADFTRTIVFPEHKYFLVFDTMSGDTEKVFTLLLHGNGGGTSGGSFSELGNGALWEQENASVRSYTIGTSDLSFATGDMMHAAYNRTPMLSHTVLKASQTGANERFLSLLYPERKEVSMPEITSAVVTNGKGLRIVSDDTTDYAAMHLSEASVIIATESEPYTSDGGFVFVSVQPDVTARHFFFIDGTFMENGPNTLVRTSNPVNLTADYRITPDIEGYIQTEQETQVTVYDIEPLKVTYRGEEISFDAVGNGVSFTVAGEGVWKVVGIEQVTELEPPGNIVVSDVGSDHGHSLSITWTPSPSENAGLVEWYRVYRSRSNVISDILPAAGFDSMEALIEWEEQNTVFIDSVATELNEYVDQAVPLNNVDYYYWLQATGSTGESEKAAAGAPTHIDESPSQFTVKQPYPNPFNASAALEYYLPYDSSVSLTVYDTLGREVIVLEDGLKSAGYYRSVWNGTDSRGLPVSSGLYVYRLSAPGIVHHGKMLLLR